MDKKKRDRLAAAGWHSGDAAKFLGLSPEEIEFVELKLALGSELMRTYTTRPLPRLRFPTILLVRTTPGGLYA